MKQKFWIILVVVLLAINTAMIVFMWMNRPGKQMPMANGPADDFLRKELSLTEAQQKQFQSAKEDHFESMRPIMEDSRSKRDEMFDEIANPQNDTAHINQLAAELSSLETKKEVNTVMHFKHLRTLLNDEQKQKFDKIFKQLLRMMSGPGRPGMQRNGPPPQDGPPPPNDSIPH
jgi:Spy/CpxP family protein refolding chaperone